MVVIILVFIQEANYSNPFKNSGIDVKILSGRKAQEEKLFYPLNSRFRSLVFLD